MVQRSRFGVVEDVESHEPRKLAKKCAPRQDVAGPSSSSPDPGEDLILLISGELRRSKVDGVRFLLTDHRMDESDDIIEICQPHLWVPSVELVELNTHASIFGIATSGK